MADSTMTPTPEGAHLGRRCVDICLDRQAENVRLYNVAKTSLLADCTLICTGKSEPHIRAIRERLERELRDLGVRPIHVEGAPASRWTILDFGSVLVHIFSPEMRAYYLLEELWADADILYSEEENEEDGEHAAAPESAPPHAPSE